MNESTQFPVVKATFRGDSREVAPGDCFIWLRQGWAIFIGNLGVWIGSTAVLMTLFFAANLVPVSRAESLACVITSRRAGRRKSLICSQDSSTIPGVW
jgi:hypothetical protein